MTVMFCDLRDSTRMSEELDIEEQRTVLRLFQDACTTVIARFRGYISRYMGDGIVVLFGYPTAHDDDAYRAVRAALDVVRKITSMTIELPSGSRSLSVRVGIATGVVVSGDLIGTNHATEQAVVGKTPNLAARLQAEAQSNGIIISETTYRLVERRVACELLPPLNLKGITGSTAAYRVVEESKANFFLPGRAPISQTRFVNRRKELRQLKQCWKMAKDGAGRVVFIQGEAGIGKSRLLFEFSSTAGAGNALILEARCSSFLTNSPLHPVFELLRSNPGFDLEDESKREKSLLNQSDLRLIKLLSEIRKTESVGVDHSEKDTVTIGQAIDSVVELFVLLSEKNTLCLILEDVHWADPSSRIMIQKLVKRVPEENIMLIVTSRQDQEPDYLSERQVIHQTLERLSSSDSKDIVNALISRTSMSKALRRIVVDKSDGVPLFVEELTRSIIDKGKTALALTSDVEYFNEENITVPETLRDSLMARLDQLESAKLVAQIGSVVGRDFSWRMLREVSELPEDILESYLDKLIDSELVFQHTELGERNFSFKHSLVQDIAYESLLKASKTDIHRRIADTIDKSFPELSKTNPELLARHYSLSGQSLNAVVQWNIASEKSLQQSAYHEALHHAREGTKWLPEIESDEQYSELSLSLYIKMCAGISGTKGDGDPEVESIYNKAREILEHSANQQLAFKLTDKLRAFYHIRGPLSQSIELGRRMMKMADEEASTQRLTDSQRCLGWSFVCYGKLRKGRQLLRASISGYRQSDSLEHTRNDTIDPGCVGLTNLAWAEWLMGNTEQATQLSNEAIVLARDIGHEYSLSYALCMGAAVYQCMGEAKTVLTMVEEVLSVATRRDYRYWIAWGQCLQGWAIAQLENSEMGIIKIRSGLAAYRETGATLFEPQILCLLAETLMLERRYSDSVIQLVLAEEVESINEIYFFSAETQRLHGLALSELGEYVKSNTHFERSLKIAEQQQAVSFEMRTRKSMLAVSSARIPI
ncbi:MAG: AAA family ATPase [Granulosicoccus sp.]